MHLTTTILVLLFTTALSNLVVTVVRVPLPLLQIAIGAAIDLAGFHVSFDPDLFLLLFIPPLLFSDAYRIPKRELTEAGVPVLALAFGLVIFTVVSVGLFIHSLLNFVPLAAAFALGAVLSPTDAVALSGILNGRALPRRFMHILQGEALLNDASGLVSFKFAVGAVVAGTFSLSDAAMNFVLVAAGGLGVGAVLGWGFFQLDQKVLTKRAEEASIYVVLILLLPFASYLLAEHLGLSGILAAVSAGLTLNFLDPFGGSHSAIRRRTFAIWSILEFSFNGLIFLLLGLQLPGILGDGVKRTIAAGYSPWQLLMVMLLITAALFILRFVWVLLTSLLRTGINKARGRRVGYGFPGFIPLLIATVAGVRGAVTLAGILSLPFYLPTGEPFPMRGLLICLASGVIVLSLLVAVVFLPFLMPRLRLPELDQFEAEIAAARRLMAESAINDLEERVEAGIKRRQGALERNAYEEAAGRVLADYRLKLEGQDDGNENHERAREDQRAEIALRLRALRSERAEMRKLRQRHAINDEAVQTLIEQLDIEEEALARIAAALPPRR
ncbi:MAG TPA: Na+/H+ antiporter [Acidisoma sp.]|uniref:Na+/H+ antiporter n=1 Tax=Acidisoma sp. TaxID=1872115 RepID=UPI002B9DABE6|nr:Na+/H+ antiporter [Acidisoma sp.]HTI02696.1 Na+/H+ antiporter [Acidisoma sp.]